MYKQIPLPSKFDKSLLSGFQVSIRIELLSHFAFCIFTKKTPKPICILCIPIEKSMILPFNHLVLN